MRIIKLAFGGFKDISGLDDSIEEVVKLLDPEAEGFTPQEAAAIVDGMLVSIQSIHNKIVEKPSADLDSNIIEAVGSDFSSAYQEVINSIGVEEFSKPENIAPIISSIRSVIENIVKLYITKGEVAAPQAPVSAPPPTPAASPAPKLVNLEGLSGTLDEKVQKVSEMLIENTMGVLSSFRNLKFIIPTNMVSSAIKSISEAVSKNKTVEGVSGAVRDLLFFESKTVQTLSKADILLAEEDGLISGDIYNKIKESRKSAGTDRDIISQSLSISNLESRARFLAENLLSSELDKYLETLEYNENVKEEEVRDRLVKVFGYSNDLVSVEKNTPPTTEGLVDLIYLLKNSTSKEARALSKMAEADKISDINEKIKYVAQNFSIDEFVEYLKYPEKHGIEQAQLDGFYNARLEVNKAKITQKSFEEKVDFIINDFTQQERILYFDQLSYPKKIETTQLLLESMDEDFTESEVASRADDLLKQYKQIVKSSKRPTKELNTSIKMLVLFQFGEEGGEEFDEEVVSEDRKALRAAQEQTNPTPNSQNLVNVLSVASQNSFVVFPSGLGTPDFVLTERNLPVLDTEALNSFVSNAKEGIHQIRLQIFPDKQGEGRFTFKPSDGPKRDLTLLISKVKYADTQTLNLIIEYQELLGRLEGEHVDAHKAALTKIKREFISKCASNSILNDTSTMYNLYITSLLISSRALSRFCLSLESQPKLESILAKKRPDIPNHGELLKSIQANTESTFNRKAKSFLELKAGDKSNFLNFLDVVAQREWFAIQSAAHSQQKTEIEKTVKRCGVCFRLIETSLAASQESKDNSFFYMSVSPFRLVPGVRGGFEPITEILFEGDELKDRIFRVSTQYLDKFLSSLTKVQRNPNYKPTNYDEKKKFKEIEFIRELVNKNQGMTWLEIKKLMLGGVLSQREGWHRRSSALLELGGFKIGSPRLIRDQFMECPSRPVDGSTGTAYSYCGAKLRPAERASDSSYVSTSNILSYQPTFSGDWKTIKDEDSPNPSTQGEGTYSELESLARPGFKYSSLSFACPCLVKPKDSEVKYYKGMFISKSEGGAGSSDFVYPTKPDGSLCTASDLQAGTRAVVVCGNATSISSFNRDQGDGNKFILETLVSTFNTSQRSYVDFMNFLLTEGYDLQDVVEINSAMINYMNQMKKNDFNKPAALSEMYNNSKHRISKLAELISQASNTSREVRLIRPKNSIQAENEESIIKTLDEIVLVCPLGHKFKIGDSKRFGEAYYGYYGLALTKPEYSKIYLSEGDENRKFLAESGLLSQDKVVAWQADKVFSSPHMYRVHIHETLGRTALNQNAEGQAEDSVTNMLIEDIGEEQKRVINKIEGEGSIPAEQQIPGTIQEYNLYSNAYYTNATNPIKQRLKEQVEAKCNKVIDMLKKILTSIDVYTRGILSRSQLVLNNLRNFDSSVDSIIEKIKDFAEDISIVIREELNNINERSEEGPDSVDPDFLDEDGIEKFKEFIASIVESLAENILNTYSIINDAVKEATTEAEIDGIFENLDTVISQRMIFKSIENAVDVHADNIFKYTIDDEFDDVVIDEDYLIERTERFARDFSNKINQAINSKGKRLVDFVIPQIKSNIKNVNDQNLLTERIAIISYAIRLSKLIIALSNRYLSPNDVSNYLGFSIGTDIGSYTYKELLKKNGIRNIISKMPKNYSEIIQAGNRSNAFPKPLDQRRGYAARLDIFYNELVRLPASVERNSTDTNAFFEANEFLKEFVREIYPNVEGLEEKINNISRSVKFFNYIPVTGYSGSIRSAAYSRCQNQAAVPFISRTLGDYRNFYSVKTYVVAPSKSSLNLRVEMPGGRMEIPQRFIYSMDSLSESDIENLLNQELESTGKNKAEISPEDLGMIRNYVISKHLKSEADKKLQEVLKPEGYLDDFIARNNKKFRSIDRRQCDYEVLANDYVIMRTNPHAITAMVEISDKTKKGGKLIVEKSPIAQGAKIPLGLEFSIEVSDFKTDPTKENFYLAYDLSDDEVVMKGDILGLGKSTLDIITPNAFLLKIFFEEVAEDQPKKTTQSKKIAQSKKTIMIYPNESKCNSYFLKTSIRPEHINILIDNMKKSGRLGDLPEESYERLRKHLSSGLVAKNIKIIYSEGADYPIESNFDNRNLQVGCFKPKDANNTIFYDTHAYVDKKSNLLNNSWIHSDNYGFSDRWSYIGFTLPFPDPTYSQTKKTNEATGLGIVSSKVVVSFDGNPLDISLLLLRGRASKGALLQEVEIAEIEELERETLEILRDIDIGPEEKNRVLRHQFDKINSYSIRLNSSPSQVPFLSPEIMGGSSAPQDVVKKVSDFFSKARMESKAEEKVESKSGLTLQLVNPFHAFRIINNPELRGARLTPAEKDALKNFIIRVFNIGPIINFAKTLNPATVVNLGKDGGFTEADAKVFLRNFDADVLFSENLGGAAASIRSVILNRINIFIKDSDWLGLPGEYFNIIIDENNPELGTHVNFRMNSSDFSATQNPGLGTVINIAKREDASEALSPTARESFRTTLGKVSGSFSKYVFPPKRTPKPQAQNKALDHAAEDGRSSNSNTSYNLERVNKLQGMIHDASDWAAAENALLDGLV